MPEIRFGTDGWRAVVGEDFTPENIADVIQAFCDLYPALPHTGWPVIVGYDRRNQSSESAELIASILLGNKIPVILSKNYCPTPAVSWMTKNKNATAGVMVTASHNPPKWNGIKFKEHTGGAASENYVRSIEEQIRKNHAQHRKPKKGELQKNKLLTFFDPSQEYLKTIMSYVDLPNIMRQLQKPVLVDPLYGAGTGLMKIILCDHVEEIHTVADPNFGGLNPEPIAPNINELLERMKSGEYTCGLILDGDADRAAVVDEHGTYITTHEFFSLLIRHAVEHKKLRGKIIKSISTTQMVNRLGKKYGLEVETVPVGFKYISPAMNEPGVLMGGEESGGYGFPFHIPERDGLFSHLLLLEHMAVTKKPLSQLVADLQKECGPMFYRRNDYHLSPEHIEKVREKFNLLNVTTCAEHKQAQHTKIDGHHFRFDDDSWLLFRASGTEPLIRIYAEAPSMKQVEVMLQEGKKHIGL